MALKKCKECGTQISTTAVACPSCGAKQRKKTHPITWIVGAMLAFIIYSFISNNSADRATSAPAEPASTQDAKPAAEARWMTSEYKDAMSDDSVTVYSLRSKNTAQFEFPYNVPGGSHLTIAVRKGKNTFDAFLKVDKGQILCGYSDCGFLVRVNEGKPVTMTGLPSSTNDADMVFVKDAKGFEKIVKAGGSIRIGLKFYKAGQQTFDFDLDGYPAK